MAAIVSELRSAIIEGRLMPGERIRQDALAEQFGVSRVPVREALKALATVGLLKHTMNSGFAVSRLEEAELVQIYRLRRLIEDDLMRPLPEVDEKHLADLTGLNEQMALLSEREDVGGMTLLNRTFHFEMFALTGSTLMIDMLAQLWDLSMPYHSTYLYDRQTRDKVLREHEQLLTALEAGDTDRYEQVAAEHRASSETALLRVVRRTSFLRRGVAQSS
ncbi:GntR family transcriptional regulator [Pseudonocardia sp. NPDC046786]|uniref:GntR family transcriptional regulator n=1 Tax=Pseudonocardia sp. NPDC046786 TaxID=3155471 RepID=UPI0033E54CCF